jgi:hypothetical protein
MGWRITGTVITGLAVCTDPNHLVWCDPSANIVGAAHRQPQATRFVVASLFLEAIEAQHPNPQPLKADEAVAHRGTC